MSRDADNLNLPPPGSPPDPLAGALAKLEPAPPRIDRDRLMFQAGAESRRWVIRLWQFTAGILAAAGFAIGARMYLRPPVVVEVERVVYRDREPTTQMPTPPQPQPQPAPTPDTAPPTPAPTPTVEAPFVHAPADVSDMAAWLELRNNVLAGGLGLIPDTGRQSSRPVGSDQPQVNPRGLLFSPW